MLKKYIFQSVLTLLIAAIALLVAHEYWLFINERYDVATKHIVQIALATWETLYMTFISTFLASLLGAALAVALILTRKGGLRENAVIYGILDVCVNTIRSFPFIILLIVLLPFTKFIVGSQIGTKATIVPLVIGSAPFIARLIESALLEVDKGIIEAAKSFGASKAQIIFRVMFPEAVPSIISAVTLTLIVIVGFTAMAGTVGGGGLGTVAINYGYQLFRPDIMTYTVIILIALVQLIQSTGDLLYKITKK